MAISFGTKAQRMLKLLLGLRNPRVASALAAYGFTEDDLREGWTLLQALGKTRFDLVNTSTDVETLRKIDEWENQWFPIALAALRRHAPAVCDQIFLNLSQMEGPAVAVSVQTFIDRVEAAARGDEPYGAGGPEATTVLATRGLTPSVIDEAKALLAQLATVAPAATPPSFEAQKEDLARAEEAAWAWYLEWGQVARVAVKQRALLRQLGFLATRSSSGSDVEEDDVDEVTSGEATAIVAP
jgi:hypothetical protein